MAETNPEQIYADIGVEPNPNFAFPQKRCKSYGKECPDAPYNSIAYCSYECYCDD